MDREKIARRSFNAVPCQTLTGGTVVLPPSDAGRYRSLLQSLAEEWAPKGQRETSLVQSIGNATWRIDHVEARQMTMYAKGRDLLSDLYPEEPEPVRTQLIELDVFELNPRPINRLQKEETRLRRQRDRDVAELRRLQAERRATEELEKALAAQAYLKAKKETKPFDPQANGFVFSTHEIERYIARRELASFLRINPARTNPAKL